MRDIAFLISNQYQIHHYAPIALNLDNVTFVIEHREEGYGVTADYISSHVPGAHVEHVTYERLQELDGRFTVIVCQTPVLPNRLLKQSLVVAQQYSLAKESYQYGLWRSLCDLNLMYGPYSVDRVCGFSNAVPVGVPTLDSLLSTEISTDRDSSMLSGGLFMPTHGALSSLAQTLPRLATIDAQFTVKLHHAYRQSGALDMPDNCHAIHADAPVDQVLKSADFVISDYSGAAYDAVAVGVPVVLVGEADPASDDFELLSETEVNGGPLHEVAATWAPGQPLEEAIGVATDRLRQNRDSFMQTMIANPGSAAEAAAAAITQLVAERSAPHPAPQVRAATATMLRNAKELAADNRRLRHANETLRTPAQRTIHNMVDPAMHKLRTLAARTPRLEKVLVAIKQRISR